MPRKLRKQRDWVGALAGVEEFAYLLGVSKSAISRWAECDLLPEPLDHLALGRVWSTDSIETFINAVAALSGRRPERGWRGNYQVSRIYATCLRREQRRAWEAVARSSPAVGRSTPAFEALVREDYWERITAAARRGTAAQPRADA